MKPDEKVVAILGRSGSQTVMGLVETNTHHMWFKTEAEMFKTMKEITDALAEWAKAGGFPQVADFDVKDFSF